MRLRSVAILGLVVALGLEAGSTPAAVAAVPRTFPPAAQAENEFLSLLNQERLNRGLPALNRVGSLDGWARRWSEFMGTDGCVRRENRRLCHRQDLLAMANDTFPNQWSLVGENVGLVPFGGSVASLHQAFMDSTTHRLNALSATFNAVGIGVSFGSDDALFVTFEFMAVRGNPNTPNDPAAGLPQPPPGTSDEDTMVLWINDLRTKNGLGPVTRHAVLDREAHYWSSLMRAGRACSRGKLVCHRPDLSSVAKAAVGSRGARWWGENVGMRSPSSLASQFLGFANSPGHRANFLRRDANLIGISFVSDPATNRTFTTIEFVSSRSPSGTPPPGGGSCGWAPSTVGKGSKGPYVRSLQCALAQRGFYGGPVDGVYSTSVVNAVKAFQAANGVRRPSGRSDLRTRRLLGVAA